MFGASLGVSVFSLIAIAKLLEKPASEYKTEEIDINALSDKYLQGYATLIDAYGTKIPGSSDGQTAIAMMKAYSKVKLDNMHCKVLRIYKPMEHPTQIFPRRHSILEYMDEEKMILEAEKEVQNPVDSFGQQPLTKNQLKKLAKKKPIDDILAAIEDDARMRDELKSTVALVMISVIENYDLTETLTGMFGRAVQKLLGKESKSKLLCVRLGLLGFHWPFRQATFFTSHAKKPVSRACEIHRAITDWNKQLPSSEKFSMLMDPTYEHTFMEKSIAPSGWVRVQFPASHIIDLRPHTGETLDEYMKAVKYRSQSGKFYQDKGKVIESYEFTDEECHKLIDMWKNTADKRGSEGHTATLAKPDYDMIKKMKSEPSEKHKRSLLFLEINGETIASSIIFRFGSTITSDIQGLDYEKSRDYKAYFVMMQYVIEMGLKEKRGFVDFGPTTAQAKLSIGCQSVPIVGGINAGWFISLCTRIAASRGLNV
ncbi:hypothetical protein CANCADRAFT_25387 [Tortispora caseinolytica NRRL Y-17796]|uniref:BioF2-like acetyltransferase domain-containing protein n=1 Tax=Tortispora caseinolytica NRRL Y-17796 TaxID=767744 RepID=A0A1E4TE25_9ASCO|nr:hypothetical protein CANCADRAFT_25387 [Tortispora caseinolytica NRRL Y-17796]